MQKNAKQLNEDILAIENMIFKDFPELVKYISEMPVKICYAIGDEIANKNLEDYHNSLKGVMDRYALTHKRNLDTK